MVARPGLVHASDAELRADPVAMAQRAVNAVARDGARVVVHFDVDAVDSRDLALANFPTTAPECLWRQPGWCYRHCSQPPVWLRSC